MYTRPNELKLVTCGPPRKFNNVAIFIPTKADLNSVKFNYNKKYLAFLMHQQHKEYYMLSHQALVGAVYDENNGLGDERINLEDYLRDSYLME